MRRCHSMLHRKRKGIFPSSSSLAAMQAATGLGYRHLNGHGVHESCHSALLYYHQAARAVLSQVGRPGGHSHVHTTRLGRSVSARSAYTRERDIVQYYEYSAETGNADAQNALGQLHMLGVNGLDKDHATARKYFEKASNRGDPEALANLGMMYANGLGCRASNETAVRLMRQAAQSGNHLGQAALGCMHLLGHGVSRDPHKAAKYIHASAEQGDPSAQFFLAVMHLHGEGVKRDGNRALHWMALAAHRGDPRAMYHLAIMQLQNNPARCTQPATLLKAVAEKGAWAFVMEDAHEDYVNGRLDSALFRYLSLAEAGMEVAQWNAGVMLEEGAGEGSFFSKGSNERLKLAQRMYRRSADQGYPAAILKVGDSLFEGWTGDPSDKERAAALYRYASENSRLAEATFNLGLMHELGNGLPQDLHLAKRYYDLARSHHSEATLPTAITLMRVSFKALQAGTYDQLGAPSASSPPSTALAVERSSGRLRIMSRSLALPLVSALSTLVLFLLGSLLFLHTARRVSAAASERRAEEDALHQHAGNEGQERTGEQTEQEESGR